ncbi:ATP-dependent helicase Lhr and Lhr-like helicase [Ornithinimicrobium cerasi]|uniref:ATP-dependent helicase Lhr and Lhr-like helicase n=2 Tax=Ornithinimicrobium cerasi TaxID=2248773 RepID=A0A285VI27_9MICO|nr:ATP-dependent helicase Lhr and Lhr-like helicase [Ornithinimicrobium cerasi]
MSGFERLDPVVQHHVVNTLGWPSLRPLQEQAVGPVLSGDDALLLAPTAGGKTEAALFPLLSRMRSEQWEGLSVLYVCPLKALLNNLEPRVSGYAGWLGRRAQVRHGDTPQSVRRRQVRERPDILLTTPESLESMLVSRLVDPRQVFADVRTVVVDEVHAFAGDDRGWHLLAVLERLTALTGRPLQRIGLSATVGNAEQLLGWLQGSNKAAEVPAIVVAPDAGAGVTPEVQLDYVGTIDNAATVIDALHHGEKRLVFADSRRTVETLAEGLRERHTETFVSHSSLSVDERRRAEQAFAEARDCVIVSTSTLELGIDVGDLDRVLQVGAPMTVASLLQRLGRTGRRSGTSRNMLFLEADDSDLLRAAGLLLLWSEGYVEPVTAPPAPRHILAQQLLGITLQHRQVGSGTWVSELGGLGLGSLEDAVAIEEWLLETGHLDRDGDMLFVGPEAERRYGVVHYRDLMAVFTADPEVQVFHGREQVGSVDPMLLLRKVTGPRLLTLAGRPWEVNYIDWKRRKAFVEPTKKGEAPRWQSMPQAQSWALADAIRRVLLGADPVGVRLTRRAVDRLGDLREEMADLVWPVGSVLAEDSARMRWWTWAGARANAVLVGALDRVAPDLLGDSIVYDNWQIGLRNDASAEWLSKALEVARTELGQDLTGALPLVDERAIKQLKFSEMLPPDMAVATLAERAADRLHARIVSGAPLRHHH